MSVIWSIGGAARAGKDTTAAIINKRLRSQRFAYADKLKECARNLSFFLPIDNLSMESVGSLSYILSLTGVQFEVYVNEVTQQKFIKFPFWDGTEEHKREPLVNLGAGARNHINPDVWIDALWRTEGIEEAVTKHGITISDVRYANENDINKEKAQELGVDHIMLYIENPNAKPQGEELEKTLPLRNKADYVVENDGQNMDKLESIVNNIIDEQGY